MADPIVLHAVTDRATGRNPTPEERFLDWLIEEHAVLLNTIEEGTLDEIRAVMSEVLEVMEERAKVVMQSSQDRLSAGIAQAQQLYRQALMQAERAIVVGQETAAREQADMLRRAFTTDQAPGIEAVGVTDWMTLSPAQLAQVADTEYFGWSTFQWTEAYSLEDGLKIDRELRASYLAGESIDDAVRRLERVTEAGRAKLETTARTAIQTASNQAAAESYRRNADVLDGVRWLATLDDRTCPQCGPLDGEVMDSQRPRLVPPLHPNCRCVLAPHVELPGLKTAPTWSEWITGEFGGLSEREVEQRQRRVLGSTVAGLLDSGALRPSDLVREDGSRRSVTDLKRMANRRKAKAA
ncbi:MAG: minor capsid protein [Rhodospirillaceae bacterium]